MKIENFRTKKWDDFRIRRKAAIVKYIKARLNQETANVMLRFALTILALKTSRRALKGIFNKARAQDRIAYLLSMSMFRYKGRMRKKGKDIDTRCKRIIRNTFTCQAIMCKREVMRV